MAQTNASDTGNSTLSSNANTAIGELIATVQTLGAIYVAETAALNKTDNAAFLALQDEKFDAAHAYQNDMGQMMARHNEIKMADRAMKEKLKEAQARFSALSSENMQALDRMQRCTEKLGNTIRNATIRDVQRARGYSYGETGALPSAAKRKMVSSGLSKTA